MSSTENKSTLYLIGIFLLLLVLAPMAWFRTTFGFDFGTAFNMTVIEILFSALVIVIFVSDFWRIIISPFLLALQYLCWIPAFNFWSDKKRLDSVKNYGLHKVGYNFLFSCPLLD